MDNAAAKYLSSDAHAVSLSMLLMGTILDRKGLDVVLPKGERLHIYIVYYDRRDEFERVAVSA